MEEHRTARRLARAVIIGQGLFTVGWIVGGAVDPGYSHVRNAVVTLGGRPAEHPWIGIAAMVVLALSVAALAPAVAATLPAHGRLVGWCFGIAGLATLGWAVFPVDCDYASQACVDRRDAGLVSWQHTVHDWVGLAMTVALLVAAFALAVALWPRPAGALALTAAVTGLAIGVASFFLWGNGANGLVDRIGILAMNVWLIAVAVGVLWAARPAPAAPPPTPLRPRDFFGRDWTGEGTFTLRPLWLWRRRPQSFRFSRKATWLSDEVWTFEDRAELSGGGWSEQRIRFCRFESPSHVRVLSSDLPDGADVLFDDDGYRILPYRMTVPLGPIPFPIRCHDEARVEADGTLVQTVDATCAGLPLARVVMHARTHPPAQTETPHEPVALPT